MVFIGAILITIYTISLIKGGMYKSLHKEYKELEKLVKDNEGNEDYVEDSDVAWKLFIKTIGALLFSLFVVFLYVCFMIGALKVDIILLPTILMLTWFFGNIVRNAVSEKAKEERKKVDLSVTKTSTQVARCIHIVYILYILILIIL